MSTQHPDNAQPPFFAQSPQLAGEEEVKEAHYAYSVLGCEEQMWDHEGKEVDNYVVPKLLAQYSSYFRKKKLGKNVFLTLRVPNPVREKASAKGLLEILESIPRSYDVARQFYQADIAPIFEIILPMTTNSLELNRIWNYYRNFVAGKADHQVIPGDITLKEWIGEFAPKTINVIPLIEDKPSLLSADMIVDGYIAGKELSYQRVFLARSDPAMTYGSAAAVLMLKVALWKLQLLENRVGFPIYPIVGLGSAPFRGNFKPTNVASRLKGYPSVQTFTVQSAFKFDYPEEVVKRSIQTIKKAQRKTAHEVDETQIIPLIENISNTYSKQVERITGLINGMAKHVPPRRKRRLHVGLFGYTRAVAGKRLPRAISFCASLYSMGIPPEMLGLANLKPHDIKVIIEHYPNFMDDMQDAMAYYDPQALSILPPRIADEIRRTVRLLKLDVGTNLIHQSLVRAMRNAMEKDDHRHMQELVTQAARERRFLG